MPRKKNNVLAIDPGTRHLGFASFQGRELEDYGVKDIRYVSGAQDMFDAAGIIVTRLITQKRPSSIALEKNNFSQIQQNERLMMVIGRIRRIARSRRIRVFEFDPRTIRKVICRNGNATKREVARTLTVRYPEMLPYLESNRRWRERYYQNAFDAIAVGLTFIAMSSTFTTHENDPRAPSKRSK